MGKRAVFFVYGVTVHLLFLVTYAWLACFVGNVGVGRSIDRSAAGAVGWAVVIDLGLIVLFGLQHSIMARPSFKRVWTKIVPEPIERTTYVLASCVVTAMLIWGWRTVDVVVWDVESRVGRAVLWGLFGTGWFMVPAVSLLINHFDLFGMRQVWLHLRGHGGYTSLPFRKPSIYSQIRHPLYVGWMILFWAAPRMTVGHLLFAAGMSAYILIAIVFEERNLVEHFGSEYAAYRREVPMFVPRRGVFGCIRLEDWTWWTWAITVALLIAGLYGSDAGFIGAMMVTAMQGAVVLIRDSDGAGFAFQLRAAFLLLLIVCYLPAMRWLYWLPTVGTSALLVFGYCLLARVLSLMPWNGREPYTLERMRRTFFSAPQLDGVEGGCSAAGGVCTIAAQVAGGQRRRPEERGG